MGQGPRWDGGSQLLEEHPKVRIPRSGTIVRGCSQRRHQAWHLDDRYREDATQDSFQSIPRRSGPRSLRASPCSASAPSSPQGRGRAHLRPQHDTEEDRSCRYGVLGASVLILALAWFAYGRAQASMGIPTSNPFRRRSAPTEVGRSIDKVHGPSKWNGDPDRGWISALALGLDQLEYEESSRRTVKATRRGRSNDVAGGSIRQGRDTTVIDDPEVLIVDADSFNNKIVLGDPLIVWSCGHSILYEAMPNAVRSIHHLRVLPEPSLRCSTTSEGTHPQSPLDLGGTEHGRPHLRDGDGCITSTRGDRG